MIAAWYEETGSARDVLVVGEMDTPEPGEGEVLVRLHASGVNPSDVKTRAGARGQMDFDWVIPHSDGAGVIEAIGKKVPQRRIDERVYVYNAAWQRPSGTAAQYVVLPEEQAVTLPDKTSFEEGACLGIPAMTAHRCVFAGGPIERKTILVSGGAGAVGHYAIQLAKWGGATVLTTVSSDEKAEHARSAGADHVINYRTEDVVEAVFDVTDDEGVDRIVEVELGGNLAVSEQILRNNGSIAAYGSMAEPEPTIPFYSFMFRGIDIETHLVYILDEEPRAAAIVGLQRAMETELLTHAVSRTFPLDRIAAAHEAVESGEVIGNVVLTLS